MLSHRLLALAVLPALVVAAPAATANHGRTVTETYLLFLPTFDLHAGDASIQFTVVDLAHAAGFEIPLLVEFFDAEDELTGSFAFCQPQFTVSVPAASVEVDVDSVRPPASVALCGSERPFVPTSGVIIAEFNGGAP